MGFNDSEVAGFSDTEVAGFNEVGWPKCLGESMDLGLDLGGIIEGEELRVSLWTRN